MISANWPVQGSPAWRLLNAGGAERPLHRQGGATQTLRILHLLSQQPGKTGSGVYLQAMVHHAARAGYVQRVIAGIPADAVMPALPHLEESRVHAVRFGGPDLPFSVAGMSDVMPYESTRFSAFTVDMLDLYLDAFGGVLKHMKEKFRPDIIHSHHLWLVTALARVLFPETPIVTTCHGTELRQLDLAPHLAPFVIPACSRVDRVMALHAEHRERIISRYGISTDAVEVVGAGYRDDIFCPPEFSWSDGEQTKTFDIVYAGKISRAKGVPWLIEALDRVRFPQGTKIRLLLAGSAGGDEGKVIQEEAARHGESVVFLGAVHQEVLAHMLREANLFVLPSFYEGLPLVVLEALASCCRVVVTDLPGMDHWLPGDLDVLGVVDRVQLPPLIGPDEPDPSGLPAFVEDLAAAITRQIHRCAGDEPDWHGAVLCHLAPMNWEGIFRKVDRVYRGVL